MRLVTYWK